MNTLNKEIRTMEISVLQQSNTLNDLKAALDRDKLVIKNDLDPKDKSFSNDEKREFYVCGLPLIKEKIKEVENLEYQVDLMKIDLRFKLRELEIVLAMHKLRDEVFK